MSPTRPRQNLRMWARIALLVCLASPTAAVAQSLPTTMRAVAIPSGPSVEERLTGVDFPAAHLLQTISATAVTPIYTNVGATIPLCVEWGVPLAVWADQVTTWCYAMAGRAAIAIAAVDATGGGSISDADGPESRGACITLPANTTGYMAPDLSTLLASTGARQELCSTQSSTSAGFGKALRYPCNDYWECVGNAVTCDYLSTSGYTGDRAAQARYQQSCAMVYARAASSALGAWRIVR